jgi:hypothetical protein
MVNLVDVSGPSDALITGTEMVPETLASFYHLTRLIAREDFINSVRRESFRSYTFFSLVTSPLIGSDILLSILLSNNLNLCSVLNVRDQVSHPYKTTGEIFF